MRPRLLSFFQTNGCWFAMLLVWIAMLSCARPPEPLSTSRPDAPSPIPPPGDLPSDALSAGPPQVPAEQVEPHRETVLPAIRFTIQTGAFATPGRAVRMATHLQAIGLDAYCFIDTDKLYKVRFERFDTREAARRRAVELQGRRLVGPYCIVRPRPANSRGNPISALREAIVQTGRRFIGIPYRWGGTSREGGFDCSGLTMTIYRLNGLDLPRSAHGQYRAGTRVERDRLEPGDLVFFATGPSGRITHVGIYTGRDRFIHAPGRGKTIRLASLATRYFRKHYSGARRYF